MATSHGLDRSGFRLNSPAGFNRNPASIRSIESDFPSYAGGWWRRTRGLFWMSFLASLLFCLLVNWVSAGSPGGHLPEGSGMADVNAR
jgi:hypothetical protein